jgi:hypothetical protein
MAADRQRLAAALAYEEERRRRMMESVPTTDNLPPVQPTRRSLRTDLENLSSGIGQGIVNQLEGVKSLVTDPVGTAKAAYEGVKGIVRDPSVLADALRYTAQKATSGPLGAGEVIGEMVSPMRGKPPVMQEIDVYHGSPHRFEEFDASKIGTGEGAQAYGHGIYLAESPDVAKSYQTALASERGFRFGDKTNLTRQEVQDLVNAQYPGYLDDVARPSLVADYVMDDMVTGLIRPEGKVPRQFKPGSEREKLFKQLQKEISHADKGALYTADLPDEMVDRMLDYDASIKSQPENIRNALQPLLDKHGIARTADIGTLISAMGRDMPQSMVSEKLRELGIPGIKYLDAGSRGQGGTGTRNFVVFPGEEKKVKILKRE